MEEIRFDDIDALSAKISDEFGPWSEPFEVSQEMIQQFADLTGDHQWIHVDVARCKRESPFGGPIAHGFLTLSLLPRLTAKTQDAVPYRIVGMGNAVNYGSESLRFIAPVPAGAKIRSRARLAAVEAGKKGTRVVREIEVGVEGSEKPALLYRMILLYQAPRG